MDQGERDVIFERVFGDANDTENCPPDGEKELAKTFSPALPRASEKFEKTAAFRKQLHDAGVRLGKLDPESPLAKFLDGTEAEAREAIRRVAA